MRRIPRSLILCFLALLFLAPVARSEVIKAHEPRYAEAILAFNAKKYREALKILDTLLNESPGLVEFLELKALALKSAKNDPESLKTYLSLIQAKTKAGSPPSSIAPYHFESGVILFRSKKHPAARPHFEFAIQQDFNRETSHFFLGMIDFQSGDFEGSLPHFEVASKSVSLELKAPALFYLGQTHLKLNDPGAAVSCFSEARTLTESQTDETSQAIYQATGAILAPLDQSRKFASLSLSLSYDSNVQALPNSLDGTLAFNKASVKNLLQAGFGYMSSPTKTFQWVPQYRLFYNYNFNRDTREGEFLNQYASLYLNHKALKKSGYGFKVDASLTFQNRVNDTTNRGTYRIFSSTGTLGAYFRNPFGSHWNSNLEASLGPQRYYTDSTLAPALQDQKRSGGFFQIREVLSGSGYGRYFNPALILSFNEIDAEGNGNQAEFASKGGAAVLSNSFLWSDRLRTSFGIFHSVTFYNRRNGPLRTDRNYALQADLNYQLNPKWTLIADASVAYNQSTVPGAFEYRRWTLSSGVSYSFY